MSAEVKVISNTALQRGTAVKITGDAPDPTALAFSGSGRIPLVVQATALDAAIDSAQVLWLRDNISPGNPGIAIELGFLDLDASALGSVGADVFLSNTGTLATAPGFTPIRVGEVSIAGAAGQVYIASTTSNATAGFGDANQGIIPSARLVFSAQPANTNTIAIGGKTFTFLDTLVAADATVQVKIGGNAAATLASLVKAINGVAAPAEWVEATTPFAVAVVADAVGTSLRIRSATARGGTANVLAAPNIALAEAIADAADIWNCANMSVSGAAAKQSRRTEGTVAITAAMVTAGSYAIELPFTPAQVLWSGYASTGILRSINEAVTIVGNAIVLALAGGASPNWQATDTFRFQAWA